MFDNVPAGIKGLATSGLNLMGGGLISSVAGAVGGLFGSGNTDPAARKTADELGGKIIRLGTPLKSQKHPATEPAPVPGTFYLDIRNGTIYESKAAGFYPVVDSWAAERTALWRQRTMAQASDSVPPMGGTGVLLIAVVVLLLLK